MTDVFEGLKVWDMSWVGVGPLTARYLADYGATVIRLDSSKRPDILRMSGPFKDGKSGLNRSHFYGDFNASKIGIGLDMNKPEARDVAMRLVSWADVLLESYTPKTMRAWGMDYEQLRTANPSLVMLSTCMQGQTGPFADYRGFGQLMASLAGFYQVTGWPDRDPTPVFGAYTDFICQRFCATALVAALDHRRRTGEGQHIDVSQYEAALQLLGTELLDYEVNGRVATRDGNRSPHACPHGAYPCEGQDRWIAICVENDEQWDVLRVTAGFEDDPSLRTFRGRKAAEDRVDGLISAWTSTHRAEELMYLLQPRVPAAVVAKATDLHADPQVRYRGYFVDLEHTEQGIVPYEGMQATMSRTPGRPRKAAPCVGEDSFSILKDVLGLNEDEIADLIASEAVEITGG